jgi:hypothetical protein
MPTTYKTDLIHHDEVDAFKEANPVGKQIVLPDVNNPGQSLVYRVEEVRVKDADDHPETGDPVKLVTTVLKS